MPACTWICVCACCRRAGCRFCPDLFEQPVDWKRTTGVWPHRGTKITAGTESLGAAVWRQQHMTERIQKIMSARGVASRRRAEDLIRQGRVTCNGLPCKLGQTANPETDQILIDGKPLPTAGEKVYILLNKPRGYVTTLSDEKGRKKRSLCGSRCSSAP